MDYHLQTIKRYSKLRAKAQANNNLKEESECCNVLGNAYLQTDDLDNALLMHKSELQICRSLRDVIGEAIAHRNIGDVYVAMNNFNEAIKHHSKHLKLSQNNDVELQRAHTSLGRTYLEYGRTIDNCEGAKTLFMKSNDMLTKSLKLVGLLKENGKASKKETNEMKIRSLINLGLCNHHLASITSSDEKSSANSKSKTYFEKAVFLANLCNFHEDLYLANYILTTVNTDQKQYSRALRNVETAVQLAKKIDKKELLYQALELCAQVHLLMENPQAAKVCFKKLYKQNAKERDDVESKLKSVIKMCHIQTEIDSLKRDKVRLYKLHETMADIYCNFVCYYPAIKHYKIQEELMHELSSLTAQQRRSVYFSIASTLVDVGEFDEAIYYYQREIECTTDKSEQSKTWTHIGNCLDKKGAASSKIDEAFITALKCSQEAGDKKLKLSTLVSFEEILKSSNRLDKARKVNHEITELEIELEICVDELEKDEEETSHNSCPLEDSEELFLTEMAISDEDASDEESCQPARRRRKVNFTKTNEKGETRLHRACIEGHLKSVEVLIKQGHLINPRDFCGWIPLHEACNHGYIEIVKFLLKHGAHINDRGGKFCDNITPINDAATNGHFDVVEELLDHGADPNIANAQGRTTLDSLICYYQQYKEDLDKESKKEYKKLYARLKSVNNHSVPPRESNDLAKKTFSKTNPTPHNISDASALVEDHLPTLIRETKKLPNSTSHAKPHSSYFDQDDCLEDIDTDSSSPPPSPLIRKHVDGTRSKPVRTNPSFVSAFDDVSIRDRRDLSITKKRRNKVDSFSKRKMATPSSSRNALIAEDQRVDDDDDWLVPDDDTYFQPIKKHRSDGYLPRVEPSLAQCVNGKVPTDVPSTPDVVAPTSPPTQKLSQPPPVQSAVRVKVRVEDKAFVFAVPKRENTIAWLRDKTSSRYEEITSQKPILSLTTSDGCLLSPEDSICDVLNNNDLVIGQVESWCCISISQRYSETCVKEDQPVLPEITNACELSENTKVLQLENYGFLFRSHLKPLISSLGQQELHKISLPGNRLDEEGVTYMCDVLQLPSSKTKTSLTELNLTCCGIMGKALACIARCEAFHRITRLNLSFNPLFDSRYVEELLANMKSLESLTLRGCLLSGVLFDDVDPPKDGLQCLEHLDISKNNLGHSGVEKWLRLLNRSRIKRIIVQKVTDANDCNQLIRSLAKFIKESETKLMLIDAAGNNFSEEELSVFASVKHLVEEVRF